MRHFSCYGLWNGPIHYWITCFTFLVYYTVTDALTVYPDREVHSTEGAATKLSCSLSEDELRLPPRTLSRCTLSWYRLVPSRREHAVTTSNVLDSQDQDVSMSLWRAHDGVPREAIVSISEMKRGLQGKYFCSLVCAGHVQSTETVTVVLDSGYLWQWKDKSTMVASVISVVLIGCLLLAAMVIALKDICRKRRRYSSDMSNSSSDILGDGSAESAYYDPPPRYSLVVVTDDDGNPRTELKHSATDADKTITPCNLVWHSLPPPNYQEALKLLRSNGVRNKRDYIQQLRTPQYCETVPRYSETDDAGRGSVLHL